MPAANPAPFTETVSVAGVVPVVGLTVSQVCVNATVKVVELGAVKFTVWEAGGEPVNTCTKAKEVADAVMVDGEVMVSATGMETKPPPPVTVMAPL